MSLATLRINGYILIWIASDDIPMLSNYTGVIVPFSYGADSEIVVAESSE